MVDCVNSNTFHPSSVFTSIEVGRYPIETEDYDLGKLTRSIVITIAKFTLKYYMLRRHLCLPKKISDWFIPLIGKISSEIYDFWSGKMSMINQSLSNPYEAGCSTSISRFLYLWQLATLSPYHSEIEQLDTRDTLSSSNLQTNWNILSVFTIRTFSSTLTRFYPRLEHSLT